MVSFLTIMHTEELHELLHIPVYRIRYRAGLDKNLNDLFQNQCPLVNIHGKPS